MTDFGTILKRLLEERGISQKWLADAANTKEATISRYVTGVNKSSRLDILVSIAKALNVSTDYLLGMTDIPQHKIDMTPEERLLLAVYRRTSERDSGLIWSVLDDYMTPAERGFIQPSNQSETKIG